MDAIGHTDGIFEYEVESGVHTEFALRRENFNAMGVLMGHAEVSRNRNLVEVETKIQCALDSAAGTLVKISIHPFFRRIHYVDGSRTDFTVTPISMDWRCLGCGVDMFSLDEYFLLRGDLWRSIVPNGDGHMCVGCVEQSLGRRLVRDDFTKPSLNGRYSDRLRDRTSL
ncbi:hypothetical protein GCM10009624_34120 [Gordonia sinesedis]